MSQRHYTDYPPATRRLIDKIILLGIRVWRREQEAQGKDTDTKIAS